MLTSVAIQLVDVLKISQIQVWKSASRFGDLRQGAVSQSRITKGIELSVKTDFIKGCFGSAKLIQSVPWKGDGLHSGLCVQAHAFGEWEQTAAGGRI